MKKMGLLLILLTLSISILFLFPLISAGITISQQPKEIYNFGDVISVPVKIVASGTTLASLNIDLMCEGEKASYKTGIPSLLYGEEYTTNTYIPLTKAEIGKLKGTCKVRIYLGTDSALTDEFEISDLILIKTYFPALEFDPGENLLIQGQAIKENGKPSDGLIELSVVDGDTIILSDTKAVDEGSFSINISLPEKIRAGALLLKLKAYEADPDGNITNEGFLDQNIRINQIPTSLEIVLESKNVEPGTNLRVKSVLYDQTGEKISSNSIITIKNKNDEIIGQTEIATDEFFEFPILYNETPSDWKVISESDNLTRESGFTILEKESIDMKILNNTLIITNTGNVPYNKTILVKIGDETLDLDIYLGVDQSQKYVLTAPDGRYNIEVTAGGNMVSEEVALTGKTIDIRKVGATGSLITHPFVWIFIILILGFVVFIVFKRGYQKTFIGHISFRSSKDKGRFFPLAKGSLVNSRNKAELSLSIKGDKQNASVIALNIKNLSEVQAKKGNTEETLQKVVDFAEENKAATYESHNTIFFILAPIKTRTFKNENTALEIAHKIKEILVNHNKIFKQRINFGISLNYGAIVAKQEQDSLKFMSLGTLMNSAKKISSLADDDILLSEKMNDLLGSRVKTKKQEKDGINIYSVKEIRNSEEHKEFLRNFLNRIEGKK